jgi:hypothetical protein
MPLGHIADPRAIAEVRPRHTEDLDRAGEPMGEAEDPLDEGGLARAVGPEDGEHVAAVHVEGDPADGGGVVIAEGGVGEPHDGWVGVHEHSCPVRRTARSARMTSR